MLGIPDHGDSRRDVEAMRSDWEQRAQADMLYSIDAQKRDWAVTDFYARGPVLVAEHVDPVLARLGIDPSGRRVLEIGCGVGRLFAGLADRFGDVCGIDISPTMIEKGRAQCPVKATWLLGDGASLDGVDSSSVDHVLAFEVFGHLPRLEFIHAYLRESWRVLRPGATFQVQLRERSDSTRQSIVRAMPRSLRVAVGRLLRAIGMEPVPGDIDTWLGILVPPGALVSFVEQLGFVDVAVLPSRPPNSTRRPHGYWLIGRKPAQPGSSSDRPAGPERGVR
jgi:SAM-dependent methyltransferase